MEKTYDKKMMWQRTIDRRDGKYWWEGYITGIFFCVTAGALIVISMMFGYMLAHYQIAEMVLYSPLVNITGI